MDKMPCRISDDPYFDASDEYDGTGVYKIKEQYEDYEDSNGTLHIDWEDMQRSVEEVVSKAVAKLNNTLEPLITPHDGDK